MNDTERAGVNELVNKLNIKEERIVDLEKENAKLEGKLADLTSEYYELENLKNNEIAELKAYNEKLLDGDIEKHNKIVQSCFFLCECSSLMQQGVERAASS